MPKGRMLNKKISYDEKVAQLTPLAALLYTWCIPHLDIEGRIYGSPHILKGTVVPFIKPLTPAKIELCLHEMVKVDLVMIYGDSHKYMQFKGFSKNQTLRPEREAGSEIPTPDQLQTNSRPTPAQEKLSKVKISKDKISKERGFAPPSLQDVSRYCQERKNKVKPQTFIDFYASKGWMVGKNKMKDWKACVRTWEQRDGSGPILKSQAVKELEANL